MRSRFTLHHPQSSLIDSDDIWTACEQNNVKRLEELLQDGADVNELDWDRKCTPVHWAASCGNLDAMEVLLEYGADINIANKHGRTPLHTLVSERYDKIVLWLVQYCNADPFLTDKKGVAAYDLAQRFFQPEIDAAIENRGVDVIDSDSEEESGEEESDDEDALPAEVQKDTIKIYSKSGSYKTLEITEYTNVDQAITLLLKKLDWPEQFHRHLDLYQLIVKTVGNKRYKKESKLDSIDNLFDVREKWPMVLTAEGQRRNENCHFLLQVKQTAPTKVHVLYTQM